MCSKIIQSLRKCFTNVQNHIILSEEAKILHSQSSYVNCWHGKKPLYFIQLNLPFLLEDKVLRGFSHVSADVSAG